MENNDLLANKLRYFAFVAYGAEEKHKTLSESLPAVMFQASNTLLANVQKSLGDALGSYMTEDEKKQFNENLQACALLGLCVFDSRIHFAKQLSDKEAESINLSDLKYTKKREPTAIEIVKLVVDSMEHDKKVDVFDQTPSYVVEAFKNITAEIFAEHKKFLDRLTEKERDMLFSGLLYLIMNVYLCGIAYVYLATMPISSNNSLQSFVKKALNIK